MNIKILTDYKKLLAEFVAFKSVATDKKYLPEISKTIDWLFNLFKKNNLQVKLLQDKKCNPKIRIS